MGERTVRVELAEREWELISSLRDLPASPLRELLEKVLQHLVRLVRQPSCPEMQADGVPCARPDSACEECQQLQQLLEALQARGPLAAGQRR